MWVDFYTEHMELLLKDMNKLITSEVLYLLGCILRGSKEIMEKFGKVSINTETVGLNSEGECIVWLNRHLEKNYPEYYSIWNEKEVVTSVLEMLKTKAEKVCLAVLSKIEDFVGR